MSLRALRTLILFGLVLLGMCGTGPALAALAPLGTVSPAGTPGAGGATAAYEYDPFGNALGATGHAAARNPFRFSTTFQDPVTRHSYYGYRFYDPANGRWLSRDPIGEAGGLNLYGFVGNDPVNAVDVLGMAGMIPWQDNVAYYGTFLLTDSNELYFQNAQTGWFGRYEGAIPASFLPYTGDIERYEDSIRVGEMAVAASAGIGDAASLSLGYWLRRGIYGNCDGVDEEDPAYAVGGALGAATGLANLAIKGLVAKGVGKVTPGSGFAMPGGGAAGATFTNGARIMDEAIAIAQSNKFVSRARRLGFSDAQINALPARLRAYRAGVGEIPTGGWASDSLFLIGRRGILSSRGQRLRHELGHVLDDLANPGLFQRSGQAGFGFRGFYNAERVAYSLQYGFNPVPLTAFNAGMQSHPVLTIGVVGGVAFGGNRLFDGWINR